METIFPNNPSDAERHLLMKQALKDVDREEDYDSILNLASPPKDITSIAPTTIGKGIKVGILGAGAAGLSAAYELRKLGFDITIIEGKDRVGGRIYTHYFDQNYFGELGAMRIPVTHETVWHYINKFKLNTIPFIQTTQNDILYVKDIRIKGIDELDKKIMEKLYPLYNLTPLEQRIPFSKLVDFVYNQPIVNMDKETRKSLLQIKKNYPPIINNIDYLNFRKACEVAGLSQSAITLLYDVLGIDRGFFYNSYIEYLRESYSVNFTYLYQIVGGNSNLPDAFYNSFKTNQFSGKVDVKFGCRVTGIYYDSLHEKVFIKYLNQQNNTLYNDQFDYIICAIPFSTLRLVEIKPLFSNEKIHAISAMYYSPSLKTSMLMKERFWETYVNGKKIIGGKSLTDLAITSAWYPSYDYGPHGVLTVSYNTFLDTMRIGNLKEPFRIFTINRQLEEVHGLKCGYMDKNMLDFVTKNWTNDDLTLGAWCIYYPEQNRIFSYPSILPEYNKRVFFAGEHVSPFHAWIQGALQTGMLAANNLASTVIRR